MNKQEFRDYVVHDVFADIQGIHHKGLFGGYGFYLEDVIFGAYMDDEKDLKGLFLKADEAFGKELEQIGAQQFIYTGHTSRGPTPMPYWHIPEDYLEDREQMKEWAYRSWEISKQSK